MPGAPFTERLVEAGGGAGISVPTAKGRSGRREEVARVSSPRKGCGFLFWGRGWGRTRPSGRPHQDSGERRVRP